MSLVSLPPASGCDSSKWTKRNSTLHTWRRDISCPATKVMNLFVIPKTYLCDLCILHCGVLCLKTCRYCSKQNTDNNNYCNSCRTVLSNFPDQPQRGQCLICGTQSAADARFCGLCSSPLVRYGWALSNPLYLPLILLIPLLFISKFMKSDSICGSSFQRKCPPVTVGNARPF